TAGGPSNSSPGVGADDPSGPGFLPNEHRIFRPMRRVPEVGATADHDSTKRSPLRTLECAEVGPSWPEMGTIWARSSDYSSDPSLPRSRRTGSAGARLRRGQPSADRALRAGQPLHHGGQRVQIRLVDGVAGDAPPGEASFQVLHHLVHRADEPAPGTSWRQ